jgi:glutaredoxin-related protein
LIDNLKDIIAKLEEANDWGTVRDVNGNFVGNWDISFEEKTV